MTRRANPYRRTRSAGALMAAAGSCLAAVALAPAALASTAEAASSGGISGLSGPTPTSTSSSVAAGPSVAGPTATSPGVAAPTASGGTVMSGTTTTSAAPSATAPATGSAGGGTSSGGTGLSSSSAAQAADPTVSVSGGGFTLQVHASGLTAHRLTFSGNAPAADSGEELVLQRAPVGTTGAATWVNAAHGTIAAGGSFAIGWTSGQSGRFQVRAVLADAATPTPLASTTPVATTTPGASTTTPAAASTTTTGQAASATGLESPAVNVTIFKAADATFYGPGLWGRHTACGEVLRKTTLGVANRTLKCGTEINVYFNGNEITVPVIDRGPYVKGVDWDLTKATANAVGLTDEIGRGTIGTLTADTLVTGTL